MINLTDKIKNDLSSSITNIKLLCYIQSGGKEYHISTESITFESPNTNLGSVYYNDLITKVGGFTESIDIRSKKVKLGGTSITLNNSKINGIRFSDKVSSSMHGGIIDVYIKTQSCDTLDDCRKIASLKITMVSHNNESFTMKCDDRFIDEFHKQLPSVDNTLYVD